MSKIKVERYSAAAAAVATVAGGGYGAQRRRRPGRTAPRVKTCAATPPPPSLGLEAAATKPALLEDTEPLDNQVAGHMFGQGKSVGMLKYKDEFILKPVAKSMCGDRETRFYEELQVTSDPVLQELRNLVPGYHGTRTVVTGGNEVTCLVLDNIAKGLKEPCIMDIKIGRRTWDPLATAEKIRNEDKKYLECKRDVGFCIPGFQVRSITDGKLHKFGKDYGKALNADTIKDALKLFLNAESGLQRPLLVQFLGLLWRILHWCRNQRKVRLYCSSLLLVYDARLLRHYIQNNKNKPQIPRPDRFKRNRPPSLAVTDLGCKDSPLLSPGFSGQFTAEGPKFERSLSASAAPISQPTSINSNSPWNKSLKKLQRTHSFSHNYEEDLQNLKQNYVYMLDDLVDDSSNLWANVKMIDFAHVFPAEGNTLDANYLDGIENLVKILEGFLQESV